MFDLLGGIDMVDFRIDTDGLNHRKFVIPEMSNTSELDGSAGGALMSEPDTYHSQQIRHAYGLHLLGDVDRGG